METPLLPLKGWTVIFDLDGTLIDTAPDLLNAMNHVLVQYDLNAINETNLRSMVGQGAKAILTKGFAFHHYEISEAQLVEAVDDFIKYYTKNLDIDSKLTPGVVNAIDDLIENGANLTVATNKTQETTDMILKSFKIYDRFVVAYGPESVSKNKPSGRHLIETVYAANGEINKSVMVGDSKTDEASAIDAKIPYIHYPYGYENAPLENVPTHSIIENFEELVPTVLRLAGYQN